MVKISEKIINRIEELFNQKTVFRFNIDKEITIYPVVINSIKIIRTYQDKINIEITEGDTNTTRDLNLYFKNKEEIYIRLEEMIKNVKTCNITSITGK